MMNTGAVRYTLSHALQPGVTLVSGAARAIQFWMGLAETLVERVQHIVVIVKRV
jgi:hypothetical protein